MARVFKNGRNQAVRIPVEMSFDTDEVTVERFGDGLLIRPLQPGGWDHFFADPALRLPDEFERPEQPPEQARRSS